MENTGVPPRNRLPAFYQSLCGIFERARQRVLNSRIWPWLALWHVLRRKVDRTSDLGVLHRVARKAFGIMQKSGEIRPLLLYIAEHRPQVVGEIGLRRGGNTFLFTRMFKDARLFLALDIRLKNVAKLRFVTPPGQQLVFVEGDSQSDDVVQKVRSVLGTSKFDFLFIDGDHSYEGVLRDFVAYYPLVRAGGLIAFHDIVPDEFARYGTRTPGSKSDAGGVYLLWSQVRDRFQSREFVDSWEQYGFGIGVIEKPADGELDAGLVQSLWNTQATNPALAARRSNRPA